QGFLTHSNFYTGSNLGSAYWHVKLLTLCCKNSLLLVIRQVVIVYAPFVNELSGFVIHAKVIDVDAFPEGIKGEDELIYPFESLAIENDSRVILCGPEATALRDLEHLSTIRGINAVLVCKIRPWLRNRGQNALWNQHRLNNLAKERRISLAQHTAGQLQQTLSFCVSRHCLDCEL